MCAQLGLSRSGYYAWPSKNPWRRATSAAELCTKVRELFEGGRGTYGCPRLYPALRREGLRLSRKRVARLMREEGLQAGQRCSCRRTTNTRHEFPVVGNVLERLFDGPAPNSVGGGRYQVHRYARGLVVSGGDPRHGLEARCRSGYRPQQGPRSVPRRAGDGPADSQGTSGAHLSLRLGLLPVRERRMPAAGRARYRLQHEPQVRLLDDAVAESYWGTLDEEFVDRAVFPTRATARSALFESIEVFYNRQRLHSHLVYLLPAEFEALDPAIAHATTTDHPRDQFNPRHLSSVRGDEYSG